MNTKPHDNYSTGKSNRQRVNDIRNRKILVLGISVIVCLFLSAGLIYQALLQRTDKSAAQLVSVSVSLSESAASQQTSESQGSWVRSGNTRKTQAVTKTPTQVLTKAPTEVPTAKPTSQTSVSKPSEITYEPLSVNIRGKNIRASVIKCIPAEALRDSEHGLYVSDNLVAAVPEIEGLSYYSLGAEYGGQRSFSNSIYDTSDEVWDILLYSYNRLESEYGITWNQSIVTDSPIWFGKKILIDCCYNMPSFEWDETAVTDWHDDLESNGYGEELSDIVQFMLPAGRVVRGFIHNQGIYMNDNHFIY